MPTILKMEGDPTDWYIQGRTLTPGQLAATGEVLAVPVTCPVTGTLLLSPSAFRTFAVWEPPTEGMPSDARIPTAQLYLPSVEGLTTETPGYPLSVSLADARDQIINAMRTGTIISIAIRDGQIFLNGARLSFVVLCEPSPPPDLTS